MSRAASVIKAFIRSTRSPALIGLALVPLAALLSSSADAQTPQIFYNPTIRGARIDRCLLWAQSCDEPSASVFCRGRGYSGAVDWQWEFTSPTYVQGSGQSCVGSLCGGFAQITCQ
jgi:hypothetical protein